VFFEVMVESFGVVNNGNRIVMKGNNVNSRLRVN
jgi:hypothetical protein